MRGASSRSCTARRRARRRRSPRRSWPSCNACARWSFSSSPASPRPSIGRTASRRSTAWRSIPRRSITRSACCSSTATTSSAWRARKPAAWLPRRARRPPPEPLMSAVSFLRKLIGGGARGGIDKRTDELVSLCNALLAESGEYASTALARNALAAYQRLDERLREEFFDMLARHYSPSPDAVGRAAAAYQANPSAENLMELQAVVEPARQELFQRLKMPPGGTAALVEMRRQPLGKLKAH